MLAPPRHESVNHVRKALMMVLVLVVIGKLQWWPM